MASTPATTINSNPFRFTVKLSADNKPACKNVVYPEENSAAVKMKRQKPRRSVESKATQVNILIENSDLPLTIKLRRVKITLPGNIKPLKKILKVSNTKAVDTKFDDDQSSTCSKQESNTDDHLSNQTRRACEEYTRVCEEFLSVWKGQMGAVLRESCDRIDNIQTRIQQIIGEINACDRVYQRLKTKSLLTFSFGELENGSNNVSTDPDDLITIEETSETSLKKTISSSTMALLPLPETQSASRSEPDIGAVSLIKPSEEVQAKPEASGDDHQAQVGEEVPETSTEEKSPLPTAELLDLLETQPSISLFEPEISPNNVITDYDDLVESFYNIQEKLEAIKNDHLAHITEKIQETHFFEEQAIFPLEKLQESLNRVVTDTKILSKLYDDSRNEDEEFKDATDALSPIIEEPSTSSIEETPTSFDILPPFPRKELEEGFNKVTTEAGHYLKLYEAAFVEREEATSACERKSTASNTTYAEDRQPLPSPELQKRSNCTTLEQRKHPNNHPTQTNGEPSNTSMDAKLPPVMVDMSNSKQELVKSASVVRRKKRLPQPAKERKIVLHESCITLARRMRMLEIKLRRSLKDNRPAASDLSKMTIQSKVRPQLSEFQAIDRKPKIQSKVRPQLSKDFQTIEKESSKSVLKKGFSPEKKSNKRDPINLHTLSKYQLPDSRSRITVAQYLDWEKYRAKQLRLQHDRELCRNLAPFLIKHFLSAGLRR